MKYAINFVDSTVKTFPTPEEREACMDRLRANGLHLNEDYTLADIPDDTKGGAVCSTQSPHSSSSSVSPGRFTK